MKKEENKKKVNKFQSEEMRVLWNILNTEQNAVYDKIDFIVILKRFIENTSQK